MEAFSENGLSELEVKDKEFSLLLKRQLTVAAAPVSVPQPVQAAMAVKPSAETSEAAAVVQDEDLEYITSPIIGTFYRAPNPEAEAYVNVGDTIRKGQVLCIIEAMKIMNEIEAEIEGTVVKVFRKNAEAVEYGQQLFAVKPL
ncbi:MAG TPA: acetyl-CoA carboxylase biotin carboxyl carrier protein [bacterium]|nr:acetyl-CoA carboxylase biotin carboxyl carrier protein [bacterium]